MLLKTKNSIISSCVRKQGRGSIIKAVNTKVRTRTEIHTFLTTKKTFKKMSNENTLCGGKKQ